MTDRTFYRPQIPQERERYFRDRERGYREHRHCRAEDHQPGGRCRPRH